MVVGTIQKTHWVLIGTVVVTAALYFFPFGQTLAYPLLMLSTLAHEMGHGLTALATGGNFHSFQMWSNGSGVAQISSTGGRLASALISAGGLVGPALVAALLFMSARRPAVARFILTALGVALIIAGFVVVRNLFGWVFVGILAAIFLFIAQQPSTWLAQTTLVFVAVQLALSVFSRSDYLFTPIAHTTAGNMPSDVAQIAQALFLPYWFWGGLCALFSVAVLVGGLWSYLRR